MRFATSCLGIFKRSAPAARTRTPAPDRSRPRFSARLESLENRCLFSTLTVTTIQDGGAGSLRANIAAAQNGDTIVFDSGLADQTISLSGGELVINKSLSIQGTPGRAE